MSYARIYKRNTQTEITTSYMMCVQAWELFFPEIFSVKLNPLNLEFITALENYRRSIEFHLQIVKQIG